MNDSKQHKPFPRCLSSSSAASRLCGLAAVAVSLSAALISGCATRDSRPSPGPAPAPAAPASASSSSPGAGAPGQWQSLFNGQNLEGWKVTDFAGGGEVRVDQGRIVLDSGATLTGVTWTGPLRKMNYEINLEAMKIDGSDFFCALTFPVAEAGCTFVVGGWGGAVVGLSSIDGQDASENETTKFMAFEKGRWYRIRARVTASRIQAWIDEDSMVDLDTTDRRIGMRFGEIELSQPLGLASYQTTAAVRQIRLRPLD